MSPGPAPVKASAPGVADVAAEAGAPTTLSTRRSDEVAAVPACRSAGGGCGAGGWCRSCVVVVVVGLTTTTRSR